MQNITNWKNECCLSEMWLLEGVEPSFCPFCGSSLIKPDTECRTCEIGPEGHELDFPEAQI